MSPPGDTGPRAVQRLPGDTPTAGPSHGGRTPDTREAWRGQGGTHCGATSVSGPPRRPGPTFPHPQERDLPSGGPAARPPRHPFIACSREGGSQNHPPNARTPLPGRGSSAPVSPGSSGGRSLAGSLPVETSQQERGCSPGPRSRPTGEQGRCPGAPGTAAAADGQ